MTRSPQTTGWEGPRTAALVVGGIAALYLARETLIPLVFAIVLALMLSPAVDLLQRWRIRRLPAALGMLLLTIILFAGTGYVIFNQLVGVLNDLPRYQASIHHKVQIWQAPSHGALGRAAQSVDQLRKELATEPEPLATRTPLRDTPVNVRNVDRAPSPLDSVRNLVQPFFSPLSTLAIVLVFTIFLLVEQIDLRNRLFRLVGPTRLNATTQALNDATHRVGRYLLLQFLVNAGFGIVCGLGLYAIGLPYAALWGALVGILRIIPYLGSAVGTLLPLLLALAVFDSLWQPILVFLLFFVLELVTANFLEPLLYGAHTGISSLALLITTIFWATLWGPAGLILSTPLTVCVVVLGRHVPQLGFLHILLGDQPVLAFEAQLYQRLLALDDFEARALVATYRHVHSPIQLYDDLILPALTLAEQDRHQGTLDPAREEFLLLSIRDMVAELGEAGPPPIRPELQPKGRVYCFAANDEADEIAAAMLTQLLSETGRPTLSIPLGVNPRTLLDLVPPTAGDTFCISTVPPMAFAHARVLSRQLRTAWPDTPILIGIWGFAGDAQRALNLFRTSPLWKEGEDHFATTLADALAHLVPAA